MDKVTKPMAILILHKAEEYTTCMKVDLKQGFKKYPVYRNIFLNKLQSDFRSPASRNSQFRHQHGGCSAVVTIDDSFMPHRAHEGHTDFGANYSPPTYANRIRFPCKVTPPPPRFLHVRIVPGDGAGPGDLPLLPLLHSGATPYSPRFTLIGSQDLDLYLLAVVSWHAPAGLRTSHECAGRGRANHVQPSNTLKNLDMRIAANEQIVTITTQEARPDKAGMRPPTESAEVREITCARLHQHLSPIRDQMILVSNQEPMRSLIEFRTTMYNRALVWLTQWGYKGEPIGVEDIGEGGREREVWWTRRLRTCASLGVVPLDGALRATIAGKCLMPESHSPDAHDINQRKRKPDRFCRPSSNFRLEMISILHRVVRHDAQNVQPCKIKSYCKISLQRGGSIAVRHVARACGCVPSRDRGQLWWLTADVNPVGKSLHMMVRLDRSPPTKANQVQSPAGSHPDFRKWELFRMMPAGLLGISPVSSALEFWSCSILTSRPVKYRRVTEWIKYKGTNWRGGRFDVDKSPFSDWQRRTSDRATCVIGERAHETVDKLLIRSKIPSNSHFWRHGSCHVLGHPATHTLRLQRCLSKDGLTSTSTRPPVERECAKPPQAMSECRVTLCCCTGRQLAEAGIFIVDHHVREQFREKFVYAGCRARTQPGVVFHVDADVEAGRQNGSAEAWFYETLASIC
ncbi:hypothetical protein PR048_015022 [Dryococelus australis]|uniref:Uncharacterized protein n=1 Tax=Dryococelus australis TaxID=614101 RepID=A0ABQ9HFU3_9NEOP|nr:hypothetical protein PR048_015022 [Dryococelus australis]